MSGPRFGGKELEHTVHPDIKKYHKSYSTSTKDLREVRAQVKQACAVCGNLKDELRRIAQQARQCKHASYCSKECQKADWPTHKFACSAADSGVNMTKIAQTLNASSFINMQLQGVFIDAFDLLRDPRVDRPFAARVDIGIEPTDPMAFVNIYGGGPAAEKAEGMVQVNAFTPLPDAWITEQAAQVWHTARASATSAGLATSPVGVLSKANALVKIFPITISPQMMNMMRNSPTFQRVSSLTGITTVVPVDVTSLIVYVPMLRFLFPRILALTLMPTKMLNKQHPADDKNKLSLRTEMTPGDVQGNTRRRQRECYSRHAPRIGPWFAPPPQLAATILKEKMGKGPDVPINHHARVEFGLCLLSERER
ncbi:hypothetical protein B0H14DRAFT_3869737 [Mycena olivaceomarginata]|nr:hypothetical protein B0H14DRAFT_3869737 [Mycena olivaceomarginata]